MAFKYFQVVVEAAPLQGAGSEPPAELLAYAQLLSEREPQFSAYSGEPLFDNTLLHQVFALKVKDSGELQERVVTSPVKIAHRIGVDQNGNIIWSSTSAAPASLIYEVSQLGYLSIHPA